MDEKEYYMDILSNFEYKHVCIGLVVGIILLFITQLPGYSFVISSLIVGFLMNKYTFDGSFFYASIITFVFICLSFGLKYTTWLTPSVDLLVIIGCLLICVFNIWLGHKFKVAYIDFNTPKVEDNINFINEDLSNENSTYDNNSEIIKNDNNSEIVKDDTNLSDEDYVSNKKDIK